MIARVLLLLAALCGTADAQILNFPPGTFSNKPALDPASGGSGPSYVLAGTASAADSGSTEVYSIPMGSTCSGSCVVVALVDYLNPLIGGFTSLTACSTSLTKQVENDALNSSLAVFSASISGCTGSQNFTLVTTAGAFVQRDICVWIATGLGSAIPTATSGSSNATSYNITVGSTSSFLFDITAIGSGTPTFAASTQAPTTVTAVTGTFANRTFCVDWNNPSTGTFSVVASSPVDQSGGVFH